ncbi:RHS repeat-associated core domain-containing protein, partial [Candidatus Gracilibacteria bacterium]|nr:RHS repeat-associated core domain-containing protein [Candidatus Gracilibacteria bacterium]
DNLGNILEEYEYDVFGKPYSKDINTGKVTNLKASTIGNTRLFTGREYERGLQLYYNRARYYNPELGRFISRDPIDISDDVNLYSYVGNSPVSFVDPMGTEKKAQAEQFRIDFIKAYDDYLEIKNKIYNIGGGYDLGFLIFPPDKKQELKLEFELKESIAKDLHYKRNSFNTLYVPENVNKLDMNEWVKLPYYKSVLHQKTAILHTPNSKFISLDGHQEVVYMNNGFLETDVEDIGTYNIYSPLENPILHNKYDVDTYYEWGNGPNDSTNKITRRLKF